MHACRAALTRAAGAGRARRGWRRLLCRRCRHWGHPREPRRLRPGPRQSARSTVRAPKPAAAAAVAAAMAAASVGAAPPAFQLVCRWMAVTLELVGANPPAAQRPRQAGRAADHPDEPAALRRSRLSHRRHPQLGRATCSADRRSASHLRLLVQLQNEPEACSPVWCLEHGAAAARRACSRLSRLASGPPLTAAAVQTPEARRPRCPATRTKLYEASTSDIGLEGCA